MLKQQNCKCCYCRQSFSDSVRPTIEHITPHSQWGRNSENVSLACQQCNMGRWNMDIEKFLDWYTYGQKQDIKIRWPRKWYHGNIIKW